MAIYFLDSLPSNCPSKRYHGYRHYSRHKNTCVVFKFVQLCRVCCIISALEFLYYLVWVLLYLSQYQNCICVLLYCVCSCTTSLYCTLGSSGDSFNQFISLHVWDEDEPDMTAVWLMFLYIKKISPKKSQFLILKWLFTDFQILKKEKIILFNCNMKQLLLVKIYLWSQI